MAGHLQALHVHLSTILRYLGLNLVSPFILLHNVLLFLHIKGSVIILHYNTARGYSVLLVLLKLRLQFAKKKKKEKKRMHNIYLCGHF